MCPTVRSSSHHSRYERPLESLVHEPSIGMSHSVYSSHWSESRASPVAAESLSLKLDQQALLEFKRESGSVLMEATSVVVVSGTVVV